MICDIPRGWGQADADLPPSEGQATWCRYHHYDASMVSYLYHSHRHRLSHQRTLREPKWIHFENTPRHTVPNTLRYTSKHFREHSPHLRLQDIIFITCQLPPAPCCNHLLGRFRGLTTLQWGAPAAGVIFLFLFSHLSRFSILFGNFYKSLRLTSVEKSLSPVTPVSSWTKRTINWRGISSPSKASLSARTDTSTSTWSRWWSLPNWHFILFFSVQSSGKIPPQGRRKR